MAPMPCTDMNSACASASTVTLRRCGLAMVAVGVMGGSGIVEIRSCVGRTLTGCITVLGGGRNWRKLALQTFRDSGHASTRSGAKNTTARQNSWEDTDGHQSP